MIKTKRIVILAMLIALTVAISILLKIPMPFPGQVLTLIDCGILLAAFAYGPVAGLLVGALTGALFDILSGYAATALWSAGVHGLEGLAVGLIVYRYARTSTSRALMSLVAMPIVVAGYFACDMVMFHSLPMAITDIFAVNIPQVILGIVIATILYNVLEKTMINVK
ncbi:MAG: ECF transporter S component [Lactobacillales bacterium]|jgi:uncharacterized membrane protein|nr:ECF transporter S component [Lactobacillales bacterium]